MIPFSRTKKKKDRGVLQHHQILGGPGTLLSKFSRETEAVNCKFELKDTMLSTESQFHSTISTVVAAAQTTVCCKNWAEGNRVIQ